MDMLTLEVGYTLIHLCVAILIAIAGAWFVWRVTR